MPPASYRHSPSHWAGTHITHTPHSPVVLSAAFSIIVERECAPFHSAANFRNESAQEYANNKEFAIDCKQGCTTRRYPVQRSTQCSWKFYLYMQKSKEEFTEAEIKVKVEIEN